MLLLVLDHLLVRLYQASRVISGRDDAREKQVKMKIITKARLLLIGRLNNKPKFYYFGGAAQRAHHIIKKYTRARSNHSFHKHPKAHIYIFKETETPTPSPHPRSNLVFSVYFLKIPNCPLYSSRATLSSSGSTRPVCGSVPNERRKRRI